VLAVAHTRTVSHAQYAKLYIESTLAPKTKFTDKEQLGFGKHFTDHMLVVSEQEGRERGIT
jgi:hypothetical protein